MKAFKHISIFIGVVTFAFLMIVSILAIEHGKSFSGEINSWTKTNQEEKLPDEGTDNLDENDVQATNLLIDYAK